MPLESQNIDFCIPLFKLQTHQVLMIVPQKNESVLFSVASKTMKYNNGTYTLIMSQVCVVVKPGCCHWLEREELVIFVPENSLIPLS